MNETARLERDNDRLAQQLGDMIEAYDKQGEELRELRAKYEVLNDFERSQCHKLLGELTRAGREFERLRRLLDGAKEDCDKLLAAGKVLEGEVAALTAERDSWRDFAQSELGARLDLLGESVDLVDNILPPRFKRMGYRNWADRLASCLEVRDSGDGVLLAYRQWRGDQP